MKNLKFTQIRQLLFNFFIVSAVLFIAYSCSNSDSISDPYTTPQPYVCTSCNSASDARVENDNSYKGIYIGVISKGSIVVNAMNSNEKLTATITIDGVKIDLIAKSMLPDKKNNYYANFIGYYYGTQVSLDFYVTGFGKNPTIVTSFLPEKIYVNKETSKFLLEVFEGEYKLKLKPIDVIEIGEKAINDSIDYTVGKYSMLVYRPQNDLEYKSGIVQSGWWRGILEVNGKYYYHNGIINESHQLIDEYKQSSGKLNADEISGFFHNQFSSNAYLSIRRVL